MRKNGRPGLPAPALSANIFLASDTRFVTFLRQDQPSFEMKLGTCMCLATAIVAAGADRAPCMLISIPNLYWTLPCLFASTTNMPPKYASRMFTLANTTHLPLHTLRQLLAAPSAMVSRSQRQLSHRLESHHQQVSYCRAALLTPLI